MKKITIVVLIIIGITAGLVLIGSGSYYFYLKHSIASCTQNLVPARNEKTGECKIFANPCQVPVSGWKEDFSCLPTVPQKENSSQAPQNKNWKTYTDQKTGISFQYPQNLSTQYITAQGWPPKIEISPEAYSCIATTTPNGKTEEKIMSGKTCITTETQGAAGSIYDQYSYKTSINGKVLILTLTLRETQCGNYPEPQKTDCNNERQTFDLDSLVDSIFQTVKL
jgi:hypothetical protein